MANVIVGKVLTADERVGIPDLLVVAIDFDLRIMDPDATSFEAAKALDPQHFSDEITPQRLGSILTDQLGRFRLDFADDLYQHKSGGDSERRPDLVLYVLAPDRPGGGSGGMSAQDRLLFHTKPIRFEAGRMESYVVLLDEALLQKHRIPVPSMAGVELQPADLRAKLIAFQQATSQRRRVKKAVFAEYVLPQLLEERREARQLLRASLPLQVAGHANFLGVSPTLSDINSRILDLLAAAYRRFSPPLARGRIYLTANDLEILGLSTARIRDGGEEVSFGELLNYLGYGSGPYRSRDLMTEVRARRAAAALTASETAEASAPSDDSPPHDPLTSPASLRQAILDRIHGQINSLSGATENHKPLDDLLRVKKTLREIELSSGVANATAMHDIQVLQTAFEPVWVAAFDQRFAKDIRALYRELVRIDATYGWNLPDISTINDLNQLREFLTEIGASGEHANLEPVDPEILRVVPWLTGAIWNRLTDEAKASIRTKVAWLSQPDDFSDSPTLGIDDPRRVAETASEIRDIVANYMTEPLSRAEELALNISSRLSEPYSFHYFAPGTVNYGIMITYRQQWTPLTYQVGRLVETVPLAPGETRSFKIVRKRRTTRKQVASEKGSVRRSREQSALNRSEIEAMEKTASAINTQLASQGSFNIGIGTIGVSNQFTTNQSRESQRLQRSFSEIARKSSEESSHETEIQLETLWEESLESEDVRTISNPNNELTVTYLLYELERRFRVHSQLYSVQPVILVALEFPAPHEIDEAWLLEHAWVLRETLLSEDLEQALDYLEEGRSQASVQLEVLEASYKSLADAADTAQMEFERLVALAKQRRDEVVALMRGDVDDGSDAGRRVARAIFTGGLSELFGGDDGRDERLKAQREAAEKALEYLESELTAASEARQYVISELRRAAESYSDALATKAQKDQLINQLRLHVRGYIHYYMHEIWRRQDPDSLFFGLYDLEVPFLEPIEETCFVVPPTPTDVDAEVPGVRIDGDLYCVEMRAPASDPAFEELPRRRLIEIADLDRPLGFRGNYAVFPLKQSSHLTDFMVMGFLDGFTGVRDPGLGTRFAPAELLNYAREVWNDDVVDLDADDKQKLAEMIVESAVKHPGNETEVILPTGQLFMEALKGGQALLEDFKLAHRGLDVLKAEEEVRRGRLDNLRRAQKLGMETPDLEDPDIDRRIVVEGTRVGVTVPEDA
jgi:hypothetical protein